MEEKFTRVLRRSRIAAVIIGIFITTFGWGQYIAVTVFHVHMLPHEQGMHAEAAEPVFSLVVACVATLIAIAVMIISFRNAQILLRRGVQGQARVVKVSAAIKNGIRPVTYAFLVDKKEYFVRKDTDAADAGNYDASTTVGVVYDPLKPKRCRIVA